MRIRTLWVWGALALASMAPGKLSGQVAWETPRMLGPHSPGGFGVYWLRAGTLPNDGDVVLVTWAAPGLPDGVSLRGGAGKGAGNEVAGFGGIDLNTPIATHSEGQPVDLSWHTGVGLGYGQYLLVTVPLGLSAGRAWSSGAVWAAPYASVGVALDLRMGGDAPDEEFDLGPSADLGLDLSLDGNRRFVLRAAVSLGDRQALVVGGSFRTGR
jgi:hypothetical protein